MAAVTISGLVLSLQMLPERYSVAAAVAAVGLALIGVGIFVYQACFLRCPRCSSWIVIPKCSDCGLELDKRVSQRKSAVS